jgi:hypothetical protein
MARRMEGRRMGISQSELEERISEGVCARIDRAGHDPVAGFFDGGIGRADNHNIVLYSPYAR